MYGIMISGRKRQVVVKGELQAITEGVRGAKSHRLKLSKPIVETKMRFF